MANKNTAAVEVLDAAAVHELVCQAGAVVVDARYWLGKHGMGLEAYRAGHLPGARFVDVDAELAESPAETTPANRPGTHTGGRHPRPGAARLGATLRRLGVEPDSTVVVYDQKTNLSAAWLWWLLRDAGFTGRIVVLDGGFSAWKRSGLPIEFDTPPDAHGSFRPVPGHLPVVDAEQVPAVLQAGHRLVDVRAAERHHGRSEHVDPVAGHIPGAINLPNTGLFAEDGTLEPLDGLRGLLGDLGEDDVVSCGSGLTASQVLMAAQVAGVPGLRLYPGSWSDWISDPSRPVATD